MPLTFDRSGRDDTTRHLPAPSSWPWCLLLLPMNHEAVPLFGRFGTNSAMSELSRVERVLVVTALSNSSQDPGSRSIL